ncbi:hypothetical protein R1T43_19375 [Alteromonas sp. CI.11.F.A3]|uniref:hypothetical protein n=1 Tax=Alteromonas sp. CI.11.F.A3 TaxID=3079555 RepID=UPI0029422752|nr:hypothetical protein [Alteromonas sp. CI.11.F.A3]WOI37323.1 hypothetical protein R1T43_19375 [Alteromonas sp. CI.11.F.A3]
MVTKSEVAKNNNRSLFINIIVITLFASLMAVFIVRLNTSEANFEAQMLRQLALKLEESAVTAHWKWQSEGRPVRILLTHYDRQGNEVGRTPVLMSHEGWPEVPPSVQGCKSLWNALLTVPMIVNGFNVRGEYFRGELVDDEAVNARCRFSLSAGDYFDYFVFRGDVVPEDEQ